MALTSCDIGSSTAGKLSPDRGLAPPGRHVTPVTTVDPPQWYVLGIGGPGQVIRVAGHALGIGGNKIPHPSPRMAAVTGGSDMRAGERETCPVVSLDLPLWLPGVLLVTIGAVRSQPPGVDVLVTAGTPLAFEDTDRPAVVVTAQTSGPGMSADQGDSGLLLVVECQVVDESVPSVPDVTYLAIGRERRMRQYRPETGPPAVESVGARMLCHAGAGEEEQGSEIDQRMLVSTNAFAHHLKTSSG